MRYSTATIALGLAVFGNQLGAYASVIPIDLVAEPIHQRAPPVAVAPPVRPPEPARPNPGPPRPAGPPRPVDPANPADPANLSDPANPARPGEAGNTVPKFPVPADPKPGELAFAPGGFMPASFKPQQKAVQPIAPFNAGLAKKLNAGAPRKPNDPLLEYKPPIEQPKDVEDAIDQRAAKYDSDDLETVAPCKRDLHTRACKRELHERACKRDFDHEGGRSLTVSKRMSGDKFAQNWATWQAGMRASSLCWILISNATQVFKLVNDRLAADPTITSPIKVYAFGGISGLSIGSRGDDGQTGDADIMFDPDTPEASKKIFWDAVARVLQDNPEILAEDYINPSMDNYLKDPAQKKAVADLSEEVAYPGEKLQVMNAFYPYQLVLKMSKITKTLEKKSNKNQQFAAKDKQDAIGFMKKTVEMFGNKKIDKESIIKWGQLLGRDEARMEQIMKLAVGPLQREYQGFADDVATIGGC
jgi:hypothetical protein